MKNETIRLLAAFVIAIVLALVVYAGSGSLLDWYEAKPWTVRLITTTIAAAASFALIGQKKSFGKIPAWVLPAVLHFVITFLEI